LKIIRGPLLLLFLKGSNQIINNTRQMNKEIWILGLHIPDRIKKSQQVQSILTKFGCSIKTRLGLHEVTDDYCSTSGIMLLELTGDLNECQKLENELLKLEDVEVKKMVFTQG